MNIEKWLHYAGIALIVIGIISGISGAATMDHETYNEAKEVYAELPDNELAAAEFNVAKEIRLSELSFVLASFLGCLISGLVLMGLSKLLAVQSDISDKMDKVMYNQKYKSE